MTTQQIAAAIQRVESVLQRRPEAGIHDDAPATAEWKSGLSLVASHPNGMQVPTDMPAEFGGTGEQVTPGWLFRAGLASCAATSILMAAAGHGIALSSLQVKALSRSDSRGLLGMKDAEGAEVYGGPGDVVLQVQISAPGFDAATLRGVAEAGVRRSPIPNLVANATPIDVRIEITGA